MEEGIEITVTQVTFIAGEADGRIIGVPTNDDSKVVIAGAEWGSALILGVAIARHEGPVLTVPRSAVIEILERPG